MTSSWPRGWLHAIGVVGRPCHDEHTAVGGVLIIVGAASAAAARSSVASIRAGSRAR
jgi:hypothetical protein